MEYLILLALISVGMAVGMAWFNLVRAHRQAQTAVATDPVQPQSVVHALRTQDELEEAVRRAASFEHRVNDERQSRADRYDALIARSAITRIPGERREEPVAVADDSVASVWAFAALVPDGTCPIA